MSLPQSYHAFRRTSKTGDQPLTVEKVVEKGPVNLEADSVLIRIHAVSLNFRDVGMLDGRYPLEVEECGIPASDCAAEVIAVGPGVRNFKTGDRVAPIFDLNRITGEEAGDMKALGGDVPGVLREYAVFEEKHLVHLPVHLSWEEASTLACAGVTAWSALGMPRTANNGKTALLQGTGGVSMFALLICLTAGIHPIITSSSDEKLASICKLAPEGSISTINYKTHPDVTAEAKRITGGRGVDVVVNNVGPTSIPHDVACLRKNGVVSLVGFLGGFDKKVDPSLFLSIMGKTAKIQGIGVGSRKDFQDLNKHLQEKQVSLKPLLDRTFNFEDSQAAFEHLSSGKHVGKVIINL